MAKTVEEWLAEGNEITRDDTTVIEENGFRWMRDRHTHADYRCVDTDVYGFRRLGSNIRVIMAYTCSANRCDGYATVLRDGRFWCPAHEHGEDE